MVIKTIISQQLQKYYRIIGLFGLFTILIVAIYSSMSDKITASNRLNEITHLHNQAIKKLNKFFSFENCSLKIQESSYFKKANEAHILNKVKLVIELNIERNLQDLAFLSIKIASKGILENTEILSNGHLLLNRQNNRCFGLIY